MKLAPCIQGDIDDTRVVRVDGIDSIPAGTTVRALVHRDPTTAVLVATVIDGTERTVRIDLGAAGGWLPSRPAVGVWKVQLEFTFPSGGVLTWPTDSDAYLAVVAELGP